MNSGPSQYSFYWHSRVKTKQLFYLRTDNNFPFFKNHGFKIHSAPFLAFEQCSPANTRGKDGKKTMNKENEQRNRQAERVARDLTGLRSLRFTVFFCFLFCFVFVFLSIPTPTTPTGRADFRSAVMWNNNPIFKRPQKGESAVVMNDSQTKLHVNKIASRFFKTKKT